MRLKNLLQYVEVQTKIVVLLPFIFGTLYSYYHFNQFSTLRFSIMFISILAFDTACNVINSYSSYRLYKTDCAFLWFKFRPETANSIIVFLLSVASVSGIVLSALTSIIFLIVGVFCFIVGVFYNFRYAFIHRMPVVEGLAGFSVGFLLVLLSIYIEYPHILYIRWSDFDSALLFDLDIKQFIGVLLVAVPFFCICFALVLCHNICDFEEDVKDRRVTFVYLIGKEEGISLFAWLYYFSYAFILLAILLSFLPWWALITFLTIPIVEININQLRRGQDKNKDFIVSVYNFMLIAFGLILSFIIDFFCVKSLSSLSFYLYFSF